MTKDYKITLIFDFQKTPYFDWNQLLMVKVTGFEYHEINNLGWFSMVLLAEVKQQKNKERINIALLGTFISLTGTKFEVFQELCAYM